MGFDTARGFQSHSSLTRFLGKAGEKWEWHHIVEQNKIGQFPVEFIHNPANAVALPVKFHREVTKHFGEPQFDTDGMALRDWLQTRPMKEQFEKGIEVIRDLGGEAYPPLHLRGL